jgi:hypothetical protein
LSHVGCIRTPPVRLVDSWSIVESIVPLPGAQEKSAKSVPCGSAWASRRSGLALLSGVGAGSTAGDALALAGSAVYSLQIALILGP